MARIGRILAWTAAVLIGAPLLLVVLVLIAGNTGPGRHLLERVVPSLTGGEVHIAGLAGRFPDQLRAAQVQIDDKSGPYLIVDNLVLDWSPLRLLHGVLDIDRLDAASADFARMPQSSGGKSSGLPVKLVLREFQLGRLTVAPAVAKQTVILALAGAATLDSMSAGSGHLDVRQLNGGGHYSLAGSIDAQHIRAAITAQEPAHGLIAGIAGMSGLGPIAIDATLDGPRSAVTTSVKASAGPLQAQAAGTLDLVHQGADLTVTATAPAMVPSPDIAWQDVSVNARVDGSFTRPQLTGQVRIDALKAEGASVTRLTATLSGNEGTAHLRAAFDGLTLPGQDPSLLAGAPVMLDATAQLAAPERPITFTLQHPIVQAHGTLRTAGPLVAHVALTLPELAPVAAAAGQDVHGHTALTLDVARQAATTTIALRGTIGITGGQKQAQALLGDAAQLDLAASLTGSDAYLTRLHVTGRGVDFSAHGSLVDARAQLAWSAAVTKLAAVDPALSGQIDASGEVSGPEQDLAATVDLRGHVGENGVESGPITAHIAAQGLPNHPSGTLTAQGALLNAPIDVALTVARETDGGISVAVQQAAWKSLAAGGTLALPPGATLPQGTLHLRIARLADFTPLLGHALAGSIDAALNATPAAAKLTLTARGLAVPGTATVSRVDLDATIANPRSQPDVQASLTVAGASAGNLSGLTARLEAHGKQNALVMTLAATAPDLAGAPARVNAAATVDVPARSMALGALQADWKQQTLRLLGPAMLDLAHGAAIDHLRLGLRQAVLAVNGRISPTLDLTASLRDLPADIATVAVPSAAANGNIAMQARLTGSLARPDGTIRITATGLRAKTGPGQALPPTNLIADAILHGTSAGLNVRLTAGSSHLALTGTAPLATTGSLDLHAGGNLDLALLDPILTAEGRRVTGQLTLSAAIAGTASAPRITGTARLTGGGAWDYTQGVHIADISVLVRASGDQIRLVNFSGRAGQGTIGASGTVGLAAPLPIDFTLTADNAELLASPLVTAIIDAHLTARGALYGTLAVAGVVHPRSVNVQIPSKLPSSVAVIPVRVAGAPAKPPPRAHPVSAPAAAGPSTVALNITLDAPRRIFIRGRGLNVELGGVVHVRGTAAHPLPSGGLDLLRGSMDLIGQTLTFTDGSIDFIGNGITDPRIHLVATSTTPTMTATLTVSGTADDPKITLSSVPPLPQDQILAQLLFHEGEGNLSPFQVAEIAAGLAELSGTTSGIGGPLDSLRNALGLDQLTVGSDAAGNPALQAGRYVAPGVYLGAQQSATGTGTEATLQINLAKGLKLVTSAGTATPSATGAAPSGQAASVGITYQFQY